jgi:hypothetical protein
LFGWDGDLIAFATAFVERRSAGVLGIVKAEGVALLQEGWGRDGDFGFLVPVEDDEAGALRIVFVR